MCKRETESLEKLRCCGQIVHSLGGFFITLYQEAIEFGWLFNWDDLVNILCSLYTLVHFASL